MICLFFIKGYKNMTQSTLECSLEQFHNRISFTLCLLNLLIEVLPTRGLAGVEIVGSFSSCGGLCTGSLSNWLRQ